MKPTIGRTVIFKLDRLTEQINRRRTNSDSIKIRINNETWPLGAQAHIGNPVMEGMEFPMTIVKVCGNGTTPVMVNGQVLLDGNDVFWATNVVEGEQDGTWHWPLRSE